MKGFNLTVMASGGGGNFLSLINKQEDVGYAIKLLVTDRHCGAIEKAVQNNIPWMQVEKGEAGADIFIKIDAGLPKDTDLIVLAGFMPVVPAWFCEKWKRKIINTHPSLLPKYGGKGMVGVKVQEAVMAAKEKYAGCTVHFVDAGIDTGEIILQKKVEVDYTKTPWEMGGIIHREENELLPEAIRILKNKKENGKLKEI